VYVLCSLACLWLYDSGYETVGTAMLVVQRVSVCQIIKLSVLVLKAARCAGIQSNS